MKIFGFYFDIICQTGDPIGEYNISPIAYGQMTHMLSSLAKGKLIMSLEVNRNDYQTIIDIVLW